MITRTQLPASASRAPPCRAGRPLRVEARRDRQVEQAIAAGAALAIDLIEQVRELLVVVGVADVRRQVIEPLRERAPDLVVDLLLLGELGDRLLHLVAEFVVRLRRARLADDRELGGHEPLLHQPVERRDELALRQIAGGAEDDDGARTGGAFETDTFAQRIVGGGVHFLFSRSSSHSV
jgi:hypothetical protein